MGWDGSIFLGESQSRLYPHMRAKFGRDPTFVSKKWSFKCISRPRFVKMLSISVADSLVTRVGVLIRGYRFRLYIVSTKCFVPEWLSCFRISILKSPHKNIVLLVCTFPKFNFFTKRVCVGCRFAIDATYKYVFWFNIISSTVIHSRMLSIDRDLLNTWLQLMFLCTCYSASFCIFSTDMEYIIH